MTYCDDFKHGYCDRTGMHVPRSWCKDGCPYYNKPAPPVVKQETPKPKKPTVEQMAKSFGRAMVKWASSGFEIVSEEEYKRRRMICNNCHGGWRCPKCGCMLWAKAALKTEECEKW